MAQQEQQLQSLAQQRAVLRETLTPSDKMRGLELGRKLLKFILEEIGDQPTHFKIIKGGMIYVFDQIAQMDDVLQQYYLENDFKTMIKKIEENGLKSKIEEWGSEVENEVQSKEKDGGPTGPEAKSEPSGTEKVKS
jgi:hypothetical protein